MKERGGEKAKGRVGKMSGRSGKEREREREKERKSERREKRRSKETVEEKNMKKSELNYMHGVMYVVNKPTIISKRSFDLSMFSLVRRMFPFRSRQFEYLLFQMNDVLPFVSKWCVNRL